MTMTIGHGEGRGGMSCMLGRIRLLLLTFHTSLTLTVSLSVQQCNLAKLLYPNSNVSVSGKQEFQERRMSNADLMSTRPTETKRLLRRSYLPTVESVP